MTKFKAQVFAVFIYGRVKYVCLYTARVCVCMDTGVESAESFYGVTITSEFTQTCPHGS